MYKDEKISCAHKNYSLQCNLPQDVLISRNFWEEMDNVDFTV